MAEKVSKATTVYYIDQYTKDGEFVRRWDSVNEITKTNPSYTMAADIFSLFRLQTINVWVCLEKGC
jgi:hypothetical protein